MVQFFLGAVVTTGCLLGGWWVLNSVWVLEQGSSALGSAAGSGVAGLEETEEELPSSVVEDPVLSEARGEGLLEAQASGPREDENPTPAAQEATAGLDQGESSDFDEEEWNAAQRKLIDQEKATGLTFVQRARLRRQLSAGGVIEPPTLRQRYGPLPEWYAGAAVGLSGASSHAAKGVPGEPGILFLAAQRLSDLITRHGDRLVECLGVQTRSWFFLRFVARVLSRNVVLHHAAQVSNTGVTQPEFEEQDWEVELQASAGPSGLQWRLVRVRSAPGGSSDLAVPSDSGVQTGGSSDLAVPSDSGVQTGGSSDLFVPSDSHVQTGGSSDLFVPSDSGVQTGGSQISSSRRIQAFRLGVAQISLLLRLRVFGLVLGSKEAGPNREVGLQMLASQLVAALVTLRM